MVVSILDTDLYKLTMQQAVIKLFPDAKVMVIKMVEATNKPCVKLSDDPGKETGNADEVARCKKELGL